MKKTIQLKTLHYAQIILFLHIFLTTVMLQAQNPTLPVGAIPGAIDVSPMGAATYTIPIEVVPGTQGVQPNLSIVYNSMSGMGTLGMKWSLAGLSAITRCGQTPYYDDNITGIGFSRIANIVTLDGERLIKTNTINANGIFSEFATEMENFTRVYSHGIFAFGGPNITTHFTAYTDDGTIFEYGNTIDSRHKLGTQEGTVLSWCINKITDANGNYMTYHYGGGGGSEIWIDSIKYTGNANSPTITPYAKVKFEYTTLPDTMGNNTCYINGYSIPQTKLLSSITVCYGNTTVRKYEFSYNTTTPQGERSTHLQKIVLKEYEENGTIKQLNPTLIEWGDKTTTLTQKTITGLPDGKILTGDFNGDGFTDIVIYDITAQGKGYNLYLYDPSINGYPQNPTVSNPHVVYAPNMLYAQNLNGDGKDVLMMGQPSYTSDKTFLFYELVNNWFVQKHSTVVFNFHTIYFGDFDGDGSTDIAYLTVAQNGNTYSWALRFHDYGKTGNLSSENIGIDSYTSSSSPGIKVFDFNGNGKANVKIRLAFSSEVKIYEYTNSGFQSIYETNTQHPLNFGNSRSFYGDVNGDGISDILNWIEVGEKWKINIAKGNGTFAEQELSIEMWILEPCNACPKDDVMFLDLNGDGKEDIIQASYNSSTKNTTFRIWLSKGVVNGEYLCDTKKTITISGKYNLKDYWHIGDFNGTGRAGILVKDTARSNDSPKIIYIDQNNDYEFVKEIEDGMGKKIQLNYKHKYCIAESKQRNPDYPNQGNYSAYRKYFLPLVESVKVPNGIGTGLNTVQYRYTTPVFSMLRRTFLGFNEFVSIDNQQNTRDSLRFYFKAIIYESEKQLLKPYEQFSFVGNQKTIIKEYFTTVIDLDHDRFVHKGGGRVFDLLANTLVVTQNTLNDQGRVTKNATQTYHGISPNPSNCMLDEIKNYVFTEITLNGNQKKTVPIEILTTQQYGTNGLIITDTLTCNYSGTGLLNWQRQGNTDGCITTTYSNYTTAGLYKQKSVSASNCPTCTTRTETFTYDNTQRFVTQIKNPKNHTANFIYNLKTGNKLSETDPNGLTTSYLYDAFGNLQKITYPDGTYTTITTDWYSDSHLPNATYKTITASAGKPELTVFCDILEREICRKDDGYYFKTIYNSKGEVVKTMGPHNAFNSPESEGITHICLYDVFGRKTSETAPYMDLSYNYQNQGRKVTITDNLRSVASYKDYDALGRIVEANDFGGTINYSYAVINDSNNKKRDQTTISAPGAITVITSDLWGNRLSIDEPNAGLITSEYNKFNELVKQTDAKGNITTYQYDVLGRVTQKQFSAPNVAPQTIEYSYDNSTFNGIGKLSKIMINNVLVEEFRYDSFSRLWRYMKRIDGIGYSFFYNYNPNGQLQKLSYPGGFAVTYSYTSTGKLSEIRRSDDNSNSLIYKVNSRNMYHAPSKCEYGNELATEYTYNPSGLLTRIKTGNTYTVLADTLSALNDENLLRGNHFLHYVDSAILNYRYAYNTKGLMSSRSESVLNQMENYTYDNLNRLTAINYGATQQTFNYQNNNGNINHNSLVGSYNYLSSKPHAVTQIDSINNEVISRNQCEVTYNFFNQPTQIIENKYQLDLYYGANQQRHKAVKKYGTIEDTCYYISKYFEVKKNAAGACQYHYIYGDNGVVALYLSTPYVDTTSGGGGGQQRAITDSMYYIHTDHLGSYCAITSPSKRVVQHNYFDPWGNFKTIFAPKTDNGKGIPPEEPQIHEEPTLNFTLIHRGFTGHEHYPYLKIINMNGRLYDPVIARFFSPDKYVANSTFTQDFNRYTYARNNPLMYTDPDGEFLWFAPLIAIAVSAAISATSHVIQVACSPGGFQNWNTMKFIASTFMGAWSGAATAGIGGAIGGVSMSTGMGVLKEFGRAGAHATVGGLTSMAGGGKFWQGAATGAISSFTGSLTHNLSVAAQIGASTIAGGVTSKISGGTFWQGAATGFAVSAFNHAIEGIVQDQQQKKLANLEDGLRKVLALAKPGQKITRNDLINTYEIPKRAASLINSFTLSEDKSSIIVDWNGIKTTAVEAFTHARFKDGTIHISEVYSPVFSRDVLYLTGGAIGIKDGENMWWNIYLATKYASPNSYFNPYYVIE